jgi:hypothetical protein
MVRNHDHHHDPNTFHYEQLFTIGVCVLLSLATVMWWVRAVLATEDTGPRGLTLFIAQRFHPLVLAGGIGLFALVVVRAVAIWRSVARAADGRESGAEHGHSCHEGCGNEHRKIAESPVTSHGHSHGHGHGHDHGWAPWRYVVLLLPVLLFVLDLPNDGLAARDISKDVKGPAGEVADKGFAPELGFRQLEMAATTPQLRAENTGKSVKLVGKYAGSEDKRFSLTRYVIGCCIADAVPINAVIMVAPNAKERLDWRKLNGKWVEVTGQVQFLTRPAASDPSTAEYVAAVVIFPKPGKPLKDLVKVVSAPANPYVN